MQSNQFLVLMCLAIILFLAILVILYFMYVKTPFYMSNLLASLSVSQTTNNGPGDHIKFNNIIKTYGSNISLDVQSAYVPSSQVSSIGTFLLLGGHSYTVTVGFSSSAVAPNLQLNIYALPTSTSTTTAQGSMFTLSPISGSSLSFTVTLSPALNQMYNIGINSTSQPITITNSGSDCYINIVQIS